MSSENENPKEEIKPEDDKNMFEEAADSLSKGYEEKKEAVSKSITETKESVSKSIDSGVKKTKSFFKKVLILSTIGLILAAAGYMLWANWTYSEGTRTGYLMKLSKKGYVFKTYEGQLNLGGLQEDNASILGNVWDFSLDYDGLSHKLEDLEGKKVMLRYKEINKAMPWQGDSNYFVYAVEEK
ncbi:MAG: hypothetical protein AB8F94_15920 [Saprospiraceae bacterium]